MAPLIDPKIQYVIITFEFFPVVQTNMFYQGFNYFRTNFHQIHTCCFALAISSPEQYIRAQISIRSAHVFFISLISVACVARKQNDDTRTFSPVLRPFFGKPLDIILWIDLKNPIRLLCNLFNSFPSCKQSFIRIRDANYNNNHVIRVFYLCVYARISWFAATKCW